MIKRWLNKVMFKKYVVFIGDNPHKQHWSPHDYRITNWLGWKLAGLFGVFVWQLGKTVCRLFGHSKKAFCIDGDMYQCCRCNRWMTFDEWLK